MTHLSHRFDLCVVGGGMAGVCAAVAAARGGAKVAIVQDRPVFGGNSSSEIRVHVCGADRHDQIPNMRETGILEEIRMENLRRNPAAQLLDLGHGPLREDPPRAQHRRTSSTAPAWTRKWTASRIKSITGWQLTT